MPNGILQEAGEGDDYFAMRKHVTKMKGLCHTAKIKSMPPETALKTETSHSAPKPENCNRRTGEACQSFY